MNKIIEETPREPEYVAPVAYYPGDGTVYIGDGDGGVAWVGSDAAYYGDPGTIWLGECAAGPGKCAAGPGM